MAGNISPQQIEEVRNRSDIVEVISRYLPLKARGKNYYGLCPFHKEKTGSFAVNPEKQIFHCFGCGAGGDVFGFLMKNEGLSFIEAVKFLADQCGVILAGKPQTPQALQKLQNRQKLFEINELAAEYFQKQLESGHAGKKAVQYLVKRGIDPNTQKKFKLGYAPAGWDGLLRYMAAKKVTAPWLKDVGLAVERQNSDGFYDRFRDRVIFPIYDYRQRLIGFGGRTLDEDKNPPKYLNSPETPIYHKGQAFYGLNWSKDAIRKASTAIVVEGYLDYIALRQAGIENTVASLGTAFTQEQAKLIGHYASELVLFFDADTAGQKAAARSFPLFLGSKMRVKVAQVPEGADPDSFVRQHGADELLKHVTQAVSLLDFVITDALKGIDKATVEGQIEAVNRILPVLAQVPNPLERSSYVTKIAQRLEINERLLLKELNKAASKRQRTLGLDKTKVNVCSNAENLAQEQLLSLMLQNERFLKAGMDKLEENDFTVPEYQEIFLILRKSEQVNMDTSSLLHKLKNEAAGNFVTKVIFESGQQSEHPQKVFDDCLKTLTRSRLRKQLRILRSQAVKDREMLHQYQKVFSQYNKLLK